MNFYEIFLLFWIFAILGWIVEVVFCSFCDRRIVNRGFLIGPYCPIYGFGALLMLLLTPYEKEPVACFVLAMFLCSVLEYLASFLMEKMFKIRWWDYSKDAFNINGRICLRNAIAFGALGIITTKYLNPLYFRLVRELSFSTLKIICIILFIITIIDIIISFKAMDSLKKIINNNLLKYQNKDATNDIKTLIFEKIKHPTYLQKRLIKTYHLLGKEKEIIKNQISKINKKTGSGYGILLLFLFLGLIIGLVISFIFKLDSYTKVIPFTISISVLIAFLIMKVGKKNEL